MCSRTTTNRRAFDQPNKGIVNSPASWCSAIIVQSLIPGRLRVTLTLRHHGPNVVGQQPAKGALDAPATCQYFETLAGGGVFDDFDGQFEAESFGPKDEVNADVATVRPPYPQPGDPTQDACRTVFALKRVGAVKINMRNAFSCFLFSMLPY